jgi:hypothetical protein
MKEHISATIDRDVLIRARKCARQARRSMSSLIELSLSQMLERETDDAGLVTSEGRFSGVFDRSECYGDR